MSEMPDFMFGSNIFTQIVSWLSDLTAEIQKSMSKLKEGRSNVTHHPDTVLTNLSTNSGSVIVF